jgi:hypothetical protein
MSHLLTDAGPVAAHIESAREPVESDCHRIDTLNVDTFLSFVGLAERGWDATRAGAMKAAYLANLRSALETLRASFGAFLDVVNEGCPEA